MNVYMPTPDADARVLSDPAIGATMPGLLLQRAAGDGNRVIMRKKDRGIWKEINWTALEAHARHVGMGLAAIGFARGERAAVLADTGPDWAYADLGILSAGGVSVGIYPASAPEQLAHVLRDSGAAVLFVQNDEQLDKALGVRPDCPDLRRIVVFDMTGLRDLDDSMGESFAALCARGAAHDAANPGVWQSGIAGIAGDDLAVLAYTAAPDGSPVGAMLNHRTVMFQVANGAAVTGQREGDERLAFLPMAHVAERILGLYQALYSGAISNYAEDTDTVVENLREVQPTILAGVPRFWERFRTRTAAAVAAATWLQRMTYRWAMGVGMRRAGRRLSGRAVPPSLAVEYWIACHLVLRNIRREIGIDRLRWGMVGTGPVAPDLIRWYLALDVALLEIYGPTVCGGLASWVGPDEVRLDNLGRPVPYGEAALTPDGEIVLRGHHLFQGYWNQPQLTARVLRDGWFHTGDIGAIENGALRIAGRRHDDMIETLYGDA